jgi:hypothetical protein
MHEPLKAVFIVYHSILPLLFDLPLCPILFNVNSFYPSMRLITFIFDNHTWSNLPSICEIFSFRATHPALGEV